MACRGFKLQAELESNSTLLLCQSHNGQTYMHKVLVNRLGGISLPRKSVVRLTDRPGMTLDVYHGCKTKQQQQKEFRL